MVELRSANVVVLAQGHNPTILHPSFLSAAKVVTPDVGNPTEVITTPAVSRVAYSSGLEVLVTGTDRLQIADTKPTFESLEKAILPGVATRYIQALPHVRYTAVGTNFSFGLLMTDPGAKIKQAFFSRDEVAGRGIQTAEVKFVHPSFLGRMQVGIAPGVVAGAFGAIVDVNYHHDLDQTRAIDDAAFQFVKYLNFLSDVRAYIDALSSLFDSIETREAARAS